MTDEKPTLRTRLEAIRTDPRVRMFGLAPLFAPLIMFGDEVVRSIEDLQERARALERRNAQLYDELQNQRRKETPEGS